MASNMAVTEESLDECSDNEEEQLLPPPLSWFEEENSSSLSPQRQQIHAAAPPQEASVSPPLLDEIVTPSSQALVGAPRKAPSWKELSSQVLPAAAQELLSTSLRRVVHTARISYARGRWHRRYSDLGNNAGGYFRDSSQDSQDLPPFSSLNWVDRQLVQEWRTVCWGESDDEDDFDRARTLVPQIHPRPVWQKADVCHECHKPFGPTLLRHHCRLCGKSYCHMHSSSSHKLPHLGYDPDVPERVCDGCKRRLVEQNLAERVAWRLARCRDFEDSNLTPYFETGVDTVEDVVLRVTKAAIAMARAIPLGAQAHVAVETVEVLRKHGLKGIYGLILRKEFLAAADLLCRVLGINKTAWPLSVHELSAAIFYALAQHRAMRGINPEREHLIHTFRSNKDGEEEAQSASAWTQESPPRLSRIHEDMDEKSSCAPEEDADNEEAVEGSVTSKWENTVSDISVMDETDTYNPMESKVPDLMDMADTAVRTPKPESAEKLPFSPVCDPVPDEVIASLLFYAPIALNFIYAEREVDMQLLAAQQGWRLLYAHLDQESHAEGPVGDRPASALFLHKEQKIACFAVRGTATINDVVTDIRQTPVPFPETETDVACAGGNARFDDDWTPVFRGQGLAVCGMARAAVNLYREHIDALVLLVQKGYRIRITGHSLGGGVATLLGALVLRHIEQEQGAAKGPISSDLLRVYGYGTPSCIDAELSEYVKSFVTTVVLHDDVIPRLTPTSIRGLLKHLLYIRETWVKIHLTNDLRAITDRARTAWAPRWRGSFTIGDSSSVKRYCRKQIQYGKKKLLSVKGSVVGSIKGDSDVEESGVSDIQVSEEAYICDDDVNADSEKQQSSDKIFTVSTIGEYPKEHQSSNEVLTLSTMGESVLEGGCYYNSPPTDKGIVPREVMGDAQPELTPLVDFMGGIDKRTKGLVIDGDEFFDTEDTLIESDDEESTGGSLSFLGPLSPERDDCEFNDEESLISEEESIAEVAIPETPVAAAEDDSWVPFDEHADSRLSGSHSGIASIDSSPKSLEEADGPEAVMLEEAPLPRMFLPGKIVHIYTHRGGYKAAFVPRAFRELRRISMAGNMLSDHTTKAYYEALLEVQTVRCAPEGLPRWTAFDEDDTCSCCASRFTWASTSDSEAQEARDKRNCRSCGTLVCDPCSQNRMPLPSVGITVSVRVCDRCYHDQGGVSMRNLGNSLASSFIEVPNQDETGRVRSGEPEHNGTLKVSLDPNTPNPTATDGSDERPERQRDRRSLVVDELASCIHSTVICK